MATRSIVIFPIKKHSERIVGKNFLLFRGTPLYQIFTTTVKESGRFDKIVVDTDSGEIAKWCMGQDIEVLPRVPSLAENTANGNSLLRYHVSKFPGYEFYWQAFVTSPMISVGTVKTLADVLHMKGTYDSVMTVKGLRGHFWSFTGKPLNYRPEVMPRSQDMPPIYQEVCGLFGISAEAFAVTQTRAGVRPYLHELPLHECADIDWPHDLQEAERNVAPVAEGYRQD